MDNILFHCQPGMEEHVWIKLTLHFNRKYFTCSSLLEATIILICSAYKLCHAMAFNGFCHYLQSRRCKICVFVFELTIEGQAPLVLVVGQQRGQHVHLVQGRPGTQRKTLSAKEENR